MRRNYVIIGLVVLVLGPATLRDRWSMMTALAVSV